VDEREAPNCMGTLDGARIGRTQHSARSVCCASGLTPRMLHRKGHSSVVCFVHDGKGSVQVCDGRSAKAAADWKRDVCCLAEGVAGHTSGSGSKA